VAYEPHRPDRTLELYEETQQIGIQVDRVGLSAAISALAQLNCVDRALEISDYMARHGLPVSAKGHGILLKVCARSGRTKQAITVFGRLQADGVQPNRYAYHDVIQCLVKESRLGCAVSMYQEMVDAGVVPLEGTRSLIKAACLKRCWNKQELACTLAHKIPGSEEVKWRSDDSSTDCGDTNISIPSEDSD